MYRRTLRCLPLLILVLTFPAEPARGADAAKLIGRVAVHEEGFYRLDPDRLRALGAPSADRVQVKRGGRPVPVAARARGGDVVFLAADVARDHSVHAVYEIWSEAAPVAGKRPALPDLEAAHTTPVPLPRLRKDDHVHGELAAAHKAVYTQNAPTWFHAAIKPGDGWSTPLDGMGARADTEQTLVARVYTNRLGVVAVTAGWGDADLGPAQVDSAVGGCVLRWKVPAEQVPTDSALVMLRDVSPPAPPPPPRDVSSRRGTLYIDAIGLEGPIDVLPAGTRLQAFVVEANGRLLPSETVRRGKGELRTYAALVGPDGLPHGAPLIANDGALAWGEVPEGVVLYAATEARSVIPTAVRPIPDPLATVGSARHVILATPLLTQAARKLSAHRTATGTSSTVIPVTDVYAHYGHGEASHHAIRAFIEALMQRSDAPLEYVLLAGDAFLDRTDRVHQVVIPTPMARTIYNGATSADRLYSLPLDGSPQGGPSIGRLPFRDASDMHAYVDRLIRYETAPPAHTSRRLLRFVTSEGRFGAFIDRLIENLFRNIITKDVSPAYDIEITFASQTSPFLWPPAEFNDKVISGLNDGALFFTYVGHGFMLGFDTLRVGEQSFPILHRDHVKRVAVTGTPPVMFVLACTTALFDGTSDGVGEALLKRPAGPVAYWGATRVCHPAYNALIGQAVARLIAKQPSATEPIRLGPILARARNEAIAPTHQTVQDRILRQGIGLLAPGAELEDLILEGAAMYTLLGDPALRLALPSGTLTVEAAVDAEAGEVVAKVKGALAPGTTVHVSLELPRNRFAGDPTPVPNPSAPESADAVRAKHGAMNDLALVRKDVRAAEKPVEIRLPLGETQPKGLVVKAWAIANGAVHQGAVVLP